jgi:hypothetical protein
MKDKYCRLYAMLNKFHNWLLAKLDRRGIKIYRGYSHDSYERSWAE